MPNPYVNKVQKSNGDVLIDLSGDTVTQAAHIVAGFIGHLASGQSVEGTAVVPIDGDNLSYGAVSAGRTGSARTGRSTTGGSV